METYTLKLLALFLFYKRKFQKFQNYHEKEYSPHQKKKRAFIYYYKKFYEQHILFFKWYKYFQTQFEIFSGSRDFFLIYKMIIKKSLKIFNPFMAKKQKNSKLFFENLFSSRIKKKKQINSPIFKNDNLYNNSSNPEVTQPYLKENEKKNLQRKLNFFLKNNGKNYNCKEYQYFGSNYSVFKLENSKNSNEERKLNKKNSFPEIKKNKIIFKTISLFNKVLEDLNKSLITI